MKKLLMWALVAVFALPFGTSTASAQEMPAGMRMEIVESDDDDNEFSIFTYKDKDGGLLYYLGIGYELNVTELLDVEILGGSLGHIDEVCLCLGSNHDEALTVLQELLSLFDKNANFTQEFPARLATGSGQLGGATAVTCIVKKKLLSGKYLQFHFISGKHTAHADLGKSTLKFLIKGLERDKKRHGN